MAQRQEIATTRKLILRQQTSPARAMLNQQVPGPQGVRIANKLDAAAQQRANARIHHIAMQNVRNVQDRVPNPAQANRVLYGQAVLQLRQTADIGRLTRIWTNPKQPLAHRVGAVRKLRNTYGIPVTEQSYRALRQAQHFHQFVAHGKEGDTFSVPLRTHFVGGSQHFTTRQTYKLEKVRGRLIPVALGADGRRLGEHVYSTPNAAAPLMNFASSVTGLVSTKSAGLIPRGTVGTPVGNTVRDVISLPRDVIDSGYYAAAALAGGKGGELWKQIKRTDPIALTAQGKFRAAGNAVYQHPLMALLEVAGARGVLRAAGRVAGVAARREAAVLPGTASAKERTFSTSPIANKLQRRREAQQIRIADQRYEQAAKADLAGEHTPEQIDHMYRRAARNDPRVMGPRDVKHIGDVHESLGQPLRRRGRAELKQAMQGHKTRVLPALSHHRGPAIWHSAEGDHKVTVTGLAGKGSDGRLYARIRESKTAVPLDELRIEHKGLLVSPKAGGHLHRLIVEGHAPVRTLADGSIDVHAIRHDLASYETDLTHQAAALKAAGEGRKLGANIKLRKRIAETLKLPDQQIADIAGRSRHISRLTNAVEQRAIDAGQLNAREALIARVKTYAFRHMGAETRIATGKLDEAANGGQLESQLVQAKDRIYTPKSANARIAQLEKMVNENGVSNATRAQIRATITRIRATRTERVYSPLSPETVIEHMKAHGVDPQDIAFVTQRELGPGSYNTRWAGKDLAPPGISTAKRTGAAVIQGLIDTHPENLTRNVIRLQQLDAANHNWTRNLSDIVNRKPNGETRTFASRAEGDKWRKSAAYNPDGTRIHGAPKWRIIRDNPWGGREEQLQNFLDHADAEGFVGQAEGGVDHPIARAIEEAVQGKDTGQGSWIAVPEDWARRIQEHSEVYRSADPTLRAVNMFFRNTVLPTSLPWLFGNVSEAALRNAIKDPRIRKNIQIFRATMAAVKEMDPEEAARLRDMLGVGHYGMSEVSNTYMSSTQFADSRMAPLADALAKVRHAPVARNVADAYSAYTDAVFHTVNQGLEHPFREAAAGAHIRDVFGTGLLKRVSRQAIEDAAKGLRGTPAQIRLADQVRRIYGQYEAFGPGQRKWMTLYSPFLAWSMNAMNFVFHVLPKDHPLVTSLIVINNRIAQDWRNKHGLNEYAPGAVPGFLQGSIPVKGGGHIRAQRYTPFGFFSDPTASLADLVLPQFSGAIHAAYGQKFTGQPDPNLKYTDQRVAGIVRGLFESMVPFYGRVQQAIGYSGSPQSRIWQTENPLKVVKKKAASAKAGTLPKGYKRPSQTLDYGQLYSAQPNEPQIDYGALYP